MAELRENRAKHMLQRGETVTAVSGHNSPDMIDFLGPLGFEAAWIEGEHGPVDFADIPDMTRACDLWGTSSVVRVNLNVAGVIYRTLDVGAQGIVVPHVNTADDARAVVDAAKFHPLGNRGNFTSRQGYGVSDYAAKANDETLLVVLIEDVVAIENLDDILTVNHIDVFFVAPGDLAQTMGYLGQAAHPEVVATVDSAIKRIVNAGRVAGTVVSDATVEHFISVGARFLLTGWPAWVTAGAQSYLRKVATASR
ncbi:MAG: hypothetical protein IH956_08930 [Chloroflexi bacterium]|nr:hypothetical protein [Chloroflexota bacterium]